MAIHNALKSANLWQGEKGGGNFKFHCKIIKFLLWRDFGQEGFWPGEILVRRILARRDFGQEGFWSGGILVRRDFGQEGF